jgi:hypothetical protein
LNKEQILALSMASLGLHTAARNVLTTLVLIHRNIDLHNRAMRYGGEEKEQWEKLLGKNNSRLKAWSEEFTVKDVIDLFDKDSEARGGTAAKHFIKRLVALGLTTLDWAHLPRKTLKGKEPKTKKAWLGQSVLLLGTLTPHAEEGLENLFGKPLSAITVGELIARKMERSSRVYSWETSYVNTQTKLREIGFSHLDGPFISANFEERKEILFRSLMTEDGLSASQAKRVVAIAVRRAWAFRDS